MIFLCIYAADGFALGAAVATGQVTVQVIVFFAVILHKVRFTDYETSSCTDCDVLEPMIRPDWSLFSLQAPAAFGLVSFLMHAGLDKKYIQGHLLAFSAAAPVVAITTYFILHAVRKRLLHDAVYPGDYTA